MAVDDVREARAQADCSSCLADGSKRCAPFASAGREKRQHFAECCSWCRITWCPNNRARDLYASIRSGELAADATP